MSTTVVEFDLMTVVRVNEHTEQSEVCERAKDDEKRSAIGKLALYFYKRADSIS